MKDGKKLSDRSSVVRSVSTSGFTIDETIWEGPGRAPTHRHPQAHLYCVIEGSGADGPAGLETAGGAEFAIREGSVWIVPPNEWHSDVNRSPVERVLRIIVDTGRFAQLEASLGKRITRIAANDLRLERLGYAMLNEMRSQRVAAGVSLEGLTLQLVATLQQMNEEGLRPPCLQEAIAMITAAPGATNRLGALARTLGVSPGRLTRLFRRHMNCSVEDFARHTRLTFAIRRLTTGKSLISHVAADAGFFDQAHLARALKRETGLTPREVRDLGTSARYPPLATARRRRRSVSVGDEPQPMDPISP